MTMFTGTHLVEFLATVTAALAARAVRGWMKRRHEPTVSPVSDETRAHLAHEDDADHV